MRNEPQYPTKGYAPHFCLAFFSWHVGFWLLHTPHISHAHSPMTKLRRIVHVPRAHAGLRLVSQDLHKILLGCSLGRFTARIFLESAWAASTVVERGAGGGGEGGQRSPPARARTVPSPRQHLTGRQFDRFFCNDRPRVRHARIISAIAFISTHEQW